MAELICTFIQKNHHPKGMIYYARNYTVSQFEVGNPELYKADGGLLSRPP